MDRWRRQNEVAVVVFGGDLLRCADGMRQGYALCADNFVEVFHGSVGVDIADGWVEAAEDTLGFTEGVSGQERYFTLRGVAAPPVVDLGKYGSLRLPVVYR